MLYVPVNNASVMSIHFLGWISSKQSAECFDHGHNTVHPVASSRTMRLAQVTNVAVDPSTQRVAFGGLYFKRGVYTSTNRT